MSATVWTPEPRTLVTDRSGTVAEFMGMDGPFALLRPVGGGREYEVLPECLRPAETGGHP